MSHAARFSIKVTHANDKRYFLSVVEKPGFQGIKVGVVLQWRMVRECECDVICICGCERSCDDVRRS